MENSKVTTLHPVEEQPTSPSILRRRADEALQSALLAQGDAIRVIQTEIDHLLSDHKDLAVQIKRCITEDGGVLEWVKRKKEQDDARREVMKKFRDSVLGYVVAGVISAIGYLGVYIWEHFWRHK